MWVKCRSSYHWFARIADYAGSPRQVSKLKYSIGLTLFFVGLLAGLCNSPHIVIPNDKEFLKLLKWIKTCEPTRSTMSSSRVGLKRNYKFQYGLKMNPIN